MAVLVRPVLIFMAIQVCQGNLGNPVLQDCMGFLVHEVKLALMEILGEKDVM